MCARVEPPDRLTAESAAAVDATYRPIPAFANWPRDPPRAELWERHLAELHELRRQVGSSEIFNGAVQTVLRAAAFETGAIERLYSTDRGLTFSVATQAAAWESQVADRSPDALSLFAAQLEAYELVLDAATKHQPVSEVWIRQLHEILTQPQETYTVLTPIGEQVRPLPRGEYKRDPNHVRAADGATHAYAPVQETAAEMGRFVRELRTSAFEASHPVVQASYAHYCLAAIHPFADGNGRVARTVASTFLYRAASVPLLVLADQRTEYFSALSEADAGDPRPFVGFIDGVARSAMDMVSEDLRTATGPQPEDAVAELRRILLAQGGLTHRELDAVAVRLANELSSTIQQRLTELELPGGVSGSPFFGGPPPAELLPSFRAVPDNVGGQMAHTVVGLQINSSAPAEAFSQTSVRILVSTARDEAETFAIVAGPPGQGAAGVPASGRKTSLVLGLRDAYPELTVAARYRLNAFVERLVGEQLAELTSAARQSLTRFGYEDDSAAGG